ncbi:MAG: hypothetical protein ACR2RE_23490 [Geminicoccaceae bacterium]
MQITPSHSTLQAFGSSQSAGQPSANVRQPAANAQVEQPKPQATQTAEAAPRAEAPARPDADSRSTVQASAPQDRPGRSVDILV